MVHADTHTQSEPLTSLAGAIAKRYGGAVVRTSVRCGKPNCRCATGSLHGPYYALVWRTARIRRKLYIPKAEAASVEAACEQTRENRRRQRQSVNESRALLRQFIYALRHF